ncbi:hypothetical protein JCM19233_4509 [Vibrio astriarenae]|nr:hypothetical protein JCM19233_4509 [Vibrio sp. C7]
MLLGGMWAIQAPNGQDLNGLVAKVHPWLNFLQQAIITL